jgi:molybdate transport system substrate-binding protein
VRRIHTLFWTLLAGMALVWPISVSAAQTAQKPCGAITVAAAADLSYAMDEIVKGFEKETGCVVRLSTGSSGNFFSQIENGAPFDVFFAADIAYPQKLEAEKLAVAGSTYLYAIGNIVMWVRNDSRIDLSQGLAALRAGSVRKISIANPQHAPYGRAAEAALRKAGVYDAIKDRIVLGESVSQAAEFVESGNADVGIIALSVALSPEMKRKGRYSAIPGDLYAPIQQGAAIVAASRNLQGAQTFLGYMKTPATAALLKRYGFDLPDKGRP